MGKYQHLFFDYDHTIWDFERNAAETLRELYITHNLQSQGFTSADIFISKYSEINYLLWQRYHNGEIQKDELRDSRFLLTFQHFNVENPALAKQISADYTTICPHKGHLIPFAHEVLTYLSKKYTLHIITNGFAEVLNIKLQKSNTTGYFKHIITSEAAGFTKPNVQIFQHGLAKSGAQLEQSLMIGDSIEADIAGALNAGMDCVFFNPNMQKSPVNATYEIRCLSELMVLL